MLVAPVPRMAVTSSCMPAATNGTPAQIPPSRQHRQASGVFLPSSGYGSLYGSKRTALLSLKRKATDCQNAGVWSRSAMGC